VKNGQNFEENAHNFSENAEINNSFCQNLDTIIININTKFHEVLITRK
jgi:hypothetical protein